MMKSGLRLSFTIILLSTVLACLPAYALETAAAPDGDAIKVASKVITDNFEKTDCGSVTLAARLDDGSIKAECDNGETYRIFVVVELGKPVALK